MADSGGDEREVYAPPPGYEFMKQDDKVCPYRHKDGDSYISGSRGWMTIYNRFRFHRTRFELQLVLEVDSVSFQFASFDGLIGSCISLASGGA
jgi:hypothetical protein